MSGNLPKSVKELKAIITKAGLSFSDCFDKKDLIERAKEASLRLKRSGTGGKVRSFEYKGFSTKIIETNPSKEKFDAVVKFKYIFLYLDYDITWARGN